VVAEGLEFKSTNADSASDLRQSPDSSGAETGAFSGQPLPDDRDLAAIVAAWPTLPAPIRRAVLALIETQLKSP
jgi:hypothetical protein